MSSKKYVKDYRLDYQLKPGGGLQGVPVYIGDYFTWKAEEAPVVNRLKYKLALLVGLGAAALVAMLWMSSLLKDGFSLLAIPMAFALIPVFLMGRAVWLIISSKMPVTRRKKDKISNSFPAGALFFMILTAAITLGLLAQLIVMGYTLYFLIYLLVSLVAVGAAILLFCHRNRLEMEPASKSDSLDILGE